MMDYVKKIPGINKERSDNIITWLKDHELISRSTLCTKVGYDASSLHRVMSGTASYVAIPPKHLDAFEAELSKYGFKVTTEHSPA